MPFKPLPIGVDDFEEIINKDYYYVDKTLFIKELLDMKGKVNLFTRPRRFGKSLNLSMLKCFFDIERTDTAALFSNLRIMSAGEAYLKHMAAYPIISLSLKSMKQSGFELSYTQMKKIIAAEFDRHRVILQSEQLTQAQKQRFLSIRDVNGTDADYLDALQFLSQCLARHYGKMVIILIDEYDVPLENAWFGGFYETMVPVIRSLFESALKTNEYLDFAVITGCLRISRESIFTGLNNLKIVSITNPAYGEHFGFTPKEVEDMLAFFERSDALATVQKWYNGYIFGDTVVYNPWSVINYTEQLWIKPNAFPQPFWSNTSSNTIVRTLVERADIKIRQEIERLIEGGSILKPVNEDMTYEDIGAEQRADNLWGFLFFTGYLKAVGEYMMDNIRYISLAIPNEEVRYVYKNTVLSWFDAKVKHKDLKELYSSLLSGEIQSLQMALEQQLRESISFYDSKEAFYHGFLLGLFGGMDEYYGDSNRESGLGRYDICLKSLDVSKPAVIIELKVAESYGKMEVKSHEGVRQILNNHYEDSLKQDGYSKILCYGIAFYKKSCKIAMTKIQNQEE